MPQRRRQARRLQRESCRVAHPISILHRMIIRNIVAGDTAVVNRGENDYISNVMVSGKLSTCFVVRPVGSAPGVPIFYHYDVP